jgi:HK97 family phage portal protein
LSSTKVISGSILKGVGDPGWTQVDLLNWSEANGLGGASKIIRRIGEFEAMRQSVFSGALDIIAQDIGKVRLNLIEETRASVTFYEPTSHPWARKLMLGPHRLQTWAGFWAHAIPELIKRQELLIYRRRRNRMDTAPDLIALNAREWTQNSDGKSFSYDVSVGTTGRSTVVGFPNATLTESEVIHIVMRSLNGYEGLSTLTIGNDVLGLNAMLVDFHAALVKGGTRPTGAIQVEGKLDDDAFARLKSQIMQALSDAAQKGEPLILEQDSKWQTIAMDAAQTDLVKARDQLSLECARLFRMPPYKLGMTGDLNRANLEVMERAYVDDTLVPNCEAIEQALTRALLTEDEILRGVKFRFDREQLYDRDPQARNQRVEMQFKEGLISLNEGRSALGKPQVPSAQDFRRLPVNSGMIYAEDGRVQVLTHNARDANDGGDTAPVDPAASGEEKRALAH